MKPNIYRYISNRALIVWKVFVKACDLIQKSNETQTDVCKHNLITSCKLHWNIIFIIGKTRNVRNIPLTVYESGKIYSSMIIKS